MSQVKNLTIDGFQQLLGKLFEYAARTENGNPKFSSVELQDMLKLHEIMKELRDLTIIEMIKEVVSKTFDDSTTAREYIAQRTAILNGKLEKLRQEMSSQVSMTTNDPAPSISALQQEYNAKERELRDLSLINGNKQEFIALMLEKYNLREEKDISFRMLKNDRLLSSYMHIPYGFYEEKTVNGERPMNIPGMQLMLQVLSKDYTSFNAIDIIKECSKESTDVYFMGFYPPGDRVELSLGIALCISSLQELAGQYRDSRAKCEVVQREYSSKGIFQMFYRDLSDELDRSYAIVRENGQILKRSFEELRFAMSNINKLGLQNLCPKIDFGVQGYDAIAEQFQRRDDLGYGIEEQRTLKDAIKSEQDKRNAEIDMKRQAAKDKMNPEFREFIHAGEITPKLAMGSMSDDQRIGAIKTLSAVIAIDSIKKGRELPKEFKKQLPDKQQFVLDATKMIEQYQVGNIENHEAKHGR